MAGAEPAPSCGLTQEQWVQFEAEGFLRLGCVCSPRLLEAMRSRIDEVMLGSVVYPNLYMQVCPSATSGSWEAYKASNDLTTAPAATLAHRKIMGLEAVSHNLAVVSL